MEIRPVSRSSTIGSRKRGKPLLIETTTVSIYANHLIAYDAELTAGTKPVTFGDTKEGMFGFRMVERSDP